jgi:hypothetical protein
MKLNALNVVSLAAGTVLGNMVAERWILRASKDDPTGVIDVSPGFGLDELARAAVIIAVTGSIEPILRKAGF